MELFELLGKISIDGTDNAKKAIDNTVKFVKTGGNEISETFSKIKKMSENIFDNNILDNFNASDRLPDLANIFENVQKSFSGNNTNIFNKISDIISSLSNSLNNTDPVLKNISSDFEWNSDNYSKGVVVELKLGNTKEVFETIDKISKSILNENASGKKIINLFNGNVSQEIENTKNIISEGMSEVSDIHFDKLEKIYSGSVSKWRKIGKTSSILTSEILDTIKNISKTILNENISGEKIFSSFDGNVSQEIENTKNIISEGMSQVSNLHLGNLEKIYSGSVSKWHKIGKTASVVTSDMAGSIHNGKHLVDSACSSVAQSAVENLKVNSSSAGEYIMNTLNSGLYSKVKQIYATASTIASTISQTLSNISVSVSGSVSSIKSNLSGYAPKTATGGIVTRAQTRIVGEDGAEAIIPLEKNTQWIDKVAERLNSSSSDAVLEKLTELNENIKSLKIYIDSGALVGEIAPKMDKKLGSIARLKRRGTV